MNKGILLIAIFSNHCLNLKTKEKLTTESVNASEQLAAFPDMEPIKIYPGEKIKHFSAFELYCRMRSIKKVADKLGIKNKSIVAVWSKKYNWVERVEKFDEDITKIMQELTRESLVESNKKHLAIVDKAIDEWSKKLDNGEISLNMVQDIEKLINIRNKLTGQESVTDQNIQVNISFK